MLLCVGLGNPGRKYKNTRHNVGFEVIDKLSEEFSTKLKQGKGEYLIGIKDGFILLKPLTYMNNSGFAVLGAIKLYNVKLDDLIVVCDDFYLPLGKIRIRKSGGAGGHNGLSSIINHLNSNNFPRLRIGIGGNFEKGSASDYVLSKFEEEEKPLVSEMIEKGKNAVLCFFENGIEKAMNLYNDK